MTRMQTEEKIAIITGGASGIGRALAEELAGRGIEVVVADRQVERSREVAAAIQARGQHAHASEVDVRSLASMKALVAATMTRHGRLDYFFNNAGIGVGGPIEAYSAADWDDVFDVNLRGCAYGVLAAYPVMIEQGFGHIINTGSIAGIMPSLGCASYAASKFGVVGLTRALRIEAAYHNIRVTLLCPGAIRTPLWKGGEYGRAKFEVFSQDRLEQFLATMHPIEPEVFARQAITQVLRGVAVIVVPRWWKLFWWLDRLIPGLTHWFAKQAFADHRRHMNVARE